MAFKARQRQTPALKSNSKQQAPNFATPTYSIKIYKLPTTKILQLLMSIFCLRPNCRSVSEEKPSHLPTPSWTQSTDVLKTSTLVPTSNFTIFDLFFHQEFPCFAS